MNVHNEIENWISEKYPTHPFTNGINNQNAENILAEYLALCLCAPYIIGGSNAKLFIDSIMTNNPIDKNIEITTAISSFLSFDETGNYNKVIEFGHKALPLLLDTSSFHSNILRDDLELLFNKNLRPITNQYLKDYFIQLSAGLSCLDSIQRCAALVALEVHSEIMIIALWNSISQVFPNINKDKLCYFYLHVGGSNPAEEYHVEITEMMIKEVVGYENVNLFLKHFDYYYSTNINLCNSILENNKIEALQ